MFHKNLRERKWIKIRDQPIDTRKVAQDKNMLETCFSRVPGFRSGIFCHFYGQPMSLLLPVLANKDTNI